MVEPNVWQMIEVTLAQWSVDDLAVTYNHEYQGKRSTRSPASGPSGGSWPTTSIMAASLASCLRCKGCSHWS